MKQKCIEIDIINLGENDFNKESDVIEYYKNVDKNKLKKIYLEYYGLKGLVD